MQELMHRIERHSFQKRIEEATDEVLELYDNGYSFRAIARRVGIDRTTVKKILFVNYRID